MVKQLLFAGLLAISANVFGQFSGNAIDLDGTNDMVVCSTVPAPFADPANNNITVEAWVYPRGSAFQRIFYAQPATNNFFTFGTSTGNVIYFYVVRNGTTYSVATSAGIAQNQWTHVAARWTSATNTVEVFFNGVLQAGANGGTSSTGTSGLMVIGSRPGGAQYLNGMVDELRVWNEARTNCEISNNYMNSITGIQPNLLVNYDFNQGVAGGNNTGVLTLPDNSGNSFNGTLTNLALTGSTSNWVSSAATLSTQGNPLGGITTIQTASVCSGGSFTFPDGTTQSNITSTATHTSTLTAANGCDSIINSTVNVLQPSSFAETNVVCSGNSYTFPDGSITTNITSQVVHVSTLVNAVGCDSLVTTTVNVNAVYSTMDTVWICSGTDYTFPDGTSFTGVTAPMSHTSTLSTVNSCDSVIARQLEILPVYAANDTGWICFGGSYTFHDGTTFTGITSAISHVSTLTTINGCDSVFTTYVDFINVDTAVTMVNETLTASASGATYQWLDCGNGYAVMPGETNQSFTATVNGTYAVEVTENGCTDTSSCFVILSTGAGHALQSAKVSFYPNPANEFVMIFCSDAVEGKVLVANLAGEIVLTETMNGNSLQLNIGSLAAGTYFLTLETAQGRVVEKMVKN